SFDAWKISGHSMVGGPENVFGPICFAQYTLNKGKLKLTAQLSPVEKVKDHRLILEGKIGTAWKELGRKAISHVSRSVNFQIDSWQSEVDIPYRLKLELPLKDGIHTYIYRGTI